MFIHICNKHSLLLLQNSMVWQSLMNYALIAKNMYIYFLNSEKITFYWADVGIFWEETHCAGLKDA